MATPFEAEDQTDEDFFNKLEEEDDDAAGIGFAAGSEPATRFSRDLSNLSIGDLGESGSGEDDQKDESGSGEDDQKDDDRISHQDLAPSNPSEQADKQADKVEVDHAGSTPEDEQVGPAVEAGSADAEAVPVSSPAEKSGGGSKVTGVKVVQWSAFSVNGSESLDDGGFGLDSGSDFLTDNSFTAASTLKADFGQEFGFGDEVDDFGAHISSAEQQGAAVSYEANNAHAADVNDSQYWENLYPGWKFDSSTGQWCQIEGYVATTGTTQSETYSNVASDSVQDTFQGNLQGAGSGFSSDQRSEVSYFQQTTQPMVGTVTEDYTSNNVSNWSQGSHGSTEYPPNMVFDPQYPGWYYDTNTQQWQSLEPYHQTLQLASDAVQDHSNAPSGFTVKENTGSYNGAVQYEQNAIQGDHKQDATGGWSMGNYVQPKTWLPEPVNQSTLGFSDTVTVQEQSNASNGFVAKENPGSYNGAVQYGQNNTIQGHNNQDAAWGWSMGNYVQPKTWLPESVNQSTLGSFNTETMQEKSNASNGFVVKENTSLYNGKVQYEQSTAQSYGNQNGGTGWSMGNYVQPKTWLPESVIQTTAGFSSTDTVQSPSNASNGSAMKENIGFYNGTLQYDQNKAEDHSNQHEGRGWSSGNYVQPKTWLPEPVNQSTVQFSSNQHIGNFNGSTGHAANHTGQQKGLDASLPSPDHGYDSTVSTNYSTGFPSFVPAENMYQYNQSTSDQSQHGSYSNQNSKGYYQQPLQSTSVPYSQFSNTHNGGRSSAGRPPHALITFGFGGKLIVMKDASSLGTQLDYGSQDTARGSISILNLMEVVTDKIQNSGITSSSCDYFHALCQGSFPGPLVGGSAATKDVNKWIDEKIVNCEAHTTDLRKGKLLKLLLSLLKISCQCYGKLRSPFGADQSLEDSDGPESAITKLFASARENSACLSEYSSSIMHCMQGLPSEEQIRRTAIEVQNLLVSGRRKEALSCAQAGQLWGPALVLAAQLGEKFYVDTVKQMAHRQLVSGSPLKTLCLLIAGQPADVFSADDSNISGLSYGANVQQPAEIPINVMLDDWEENLAIITANRTKDDELVIIHLGDCLWRERGEITAAHTCYLVAEANFESYSDSARLCLIGADHWKCPRTYASPEAIQRTELYEYSKVLGNSQFILLQFQPYKLIYAYMLAEVGKVTDSLRYCQASLKLLKSSARSPEVEMWKLLLSSLEERIRTHQQGGFSTNLAPAKLVGKLITSIDKSIHRIMGAPTPSLPPMPPSSVNGKENYSVVPKVANSQSTMAMSSLIPSPSVESINEWPGDTSRKTMQNRSVSEPDFGRSPKQDQLKDASTSNAQSKTSSSGGPSRFGRIGSQLIQKTMGWVSISRSDRQAKLGQTNKFYYDEKLKRWVEEGAEPPAEEPALQPPPTTASFLNGTSNHNIESSFKTQNRAVNEGAEMKLPPPSEYSSGILNSLPSPNHFSVRSAAGIRSRYVDTFNKSGGAPMKSFQSPATPSVKPLAGAKFFVPATPAASDEHIANSTRESIHEADANGESSASVVNNGSFSSPPQSVHSIHETGANGNGEGSAPIANNGSFYSPPPLMHYNGNGEGSAPIANNGSFYSPPPLMHYSRDDGANGEGSAPIANNGPSFSPPPTMHKFPSMDNITNSSTMGQMTTPQNIGGSFASRSRAASWSGSVDAVLNSKEDKPNTLGNGLGGTSPFMPGNSSNPQRGTSPLQVNGSTLGDDLHEVEL